jgi:hypothetical protein
MPLSRFTELIFDPEHLQFLSFRSILDAKLKSISHPVPRTKHLIFL